MSAEQITIEAYLGYQHPYFEFAVTNLMSMRSLKQVILFEWQIRLTHNPELAKARDIITADNTAQLEAVWQACPHYHEWVHAEQEDMYVKCTVVDGHRTITVATEPHPQPLVAFVYTLKGKLP